eukprot:m.102458 g.102458  ORF g.102458 m.102458 type:complete len:75 (-) comp13222_c0_seq1:35-259(-)
MMCKFMSFSVSRAFSRVCVRFLLCGKRLCHVELGYCVIVVKGSSTVGQIVKAHLALLCMHMNVSAPVLTFIVMR